MVVARDAGERGGGGRGREERERLELEKRGGAGAEGAAPEGVGGAPLGEEVVGGGGELVEGVEDGLVREEGACRDEAGAAGPRGCGGGRGSVYRRCC